MKTKFEPMPAPKLTIQEARIAGIIGLLLFIVGLPVLVVLFCYFQ